MGKYYINQYIKNIAKKNSGEENQNIINDIFIDVGEFPQNNFIVIDDYEIVKQLTDKVLLIKSGNLFYPRTSDILINTTVISNYFANLEPEGIESVSIKCTFGNIEWRHDTKEIESISAVSLIYYYDANLDTRKYALYFYEF